MRDFKAIIREGSSRYQEWMTVFGGNEVFIKSPIPHEGSAPGIEHGLFYLIDLDELTETQKTVWSSTWLPNSTFQSRR